MTVEEYQLALCLVDGPCPRCSGTGKNLQIPGVYFKFVDQEGVACPACNGSGRVPLLDPKLVRTIPSNFLKQIEVFGTCWLWRGHKTKNGYGRYQFGHGAKMVAHKYVYLKLFGSIPEGKELDHTCGNRACVHPLHLEAVTSHENNLRSNSPMMTRWRWRNQTHCVHGHLYSAENTYLSKEGWRYCRACHRNSENKRRVAKALGVKE